MKSSQKRFGQNFLVDIRKANRIVEALRIENGDQILEIGPGRGVLTERILKQGAILTAVELDRNLIPNLNERFGDNSRFKLIEKDIIKFDLSDFDSIRLKIIGNIPYNISGALIEWLIEQFDFVNLAVITVQKEVADRIRAKPGKREYGSLSVLAQMFFKIVRLFDIPPGCFSPPPKVKSSVIKLEPDLRLYENIDFNIFREFIYACFAQKRKTLVNSLGASGEFSKDRIEKSLVSLGKRTDIRAEHISGAEFMGLYNILTKNE